MKTPEELFKEHYKGFTSTSSADGYKKGFMLGNKVTANEYRNMLEDVVNELDLSEIAVEHHGQVGTPPAELVKLVLEAKDETIARLKAGMKMIEGHT